MTAAIKKSDAWRHFLLLLISGGTLMASAQTGSAQSRGELLYATHCIACHTSELHWRDNRRASDWQSLNAQVRLWQGNAGLQWSDADIADVAHYLNDRIYHYPQSTGDLQLSIFQHSQKINGRNTPVSGVDSPN
ncbi:MAG: cytochrome C [Pseudomonadota bacterium]